MSLNEVLDRTCAALDHANKQNAECLRMMAEKDQEIAELKAAIEEMKETNSGPVLHHFKV